MRRSLMASIVTAALVVLTLSFVAAPVRGKPDLSGVWWQGADLPRIGTHCRHGHGTPRSSIISLQEPRYEQNDT